jgi:tripartite-type tricarboxylate transporter receptor subunit TctC
MKKSTLSMASVLGAAMLAGAFVAPATAETDAGFFKKNRITFHIGFGVGGGYDTYARALVHHMGRHIPGNPSFVVRNFPGAGSLRLANELYNILPQNGSALGMIGRGMPMEVLFGNKQAKYDPTKFNWIGSMNNEVSICVT